MTDDVFPDPDTPFGERVQRRLRDEAVIWLTTVGSDGTPQPNPVWFVPEGSDILIYNQLGAHRLTHIQDNPRVSLNFDDDGDGGDIVVMCGRAEVLADHPRANETPSYMDKYRDAAIEVSGDLDAFSAAYP